MREYQVVITDKKDGKELYNETSTCFLGVATNSKTGGIVPTFTNIVVSEDTALTVASTMLKTVELLTGLCGKYPAIKVIFYDMLEKMDKELREEVKTYVE